MCGAVSAAWHKEKLDYIGSNAESSIALDSFGNPGICYYSPKTHDLKYTYKKGKKWIKQTVDNIGDVGIGDVFNYCSLQIGTNNLPQISYYDATNKNLKYARWTGRSWVKQTVDSPGNVGGTNSLALDTTNKPHISYYDATNGDLKYARWTGRSWVKQTVDGSGKVGKSNSLALTSNNLPRICYTSDHDLKYASLIGKSWTKTTLAYHHTYYEYPGETYQLYTGTGCSLVLDNLNRPHIICRDEYPLSDDVYYDILYIDGKKSHLGILTLCGILDMDLDSHNNPHFVKNELFISKHGNSWWASSTFDSAALSHLTLDSSDLPRISYTKGGYLMYAYMGQFTITQIKTGAALVQSYVKKYHKLPVRVNVAGYCVNMPQFLHLSTNAVLKIFAGIKTDCILGNFEPASTSAETLHAGPIYKSEYIKIANYIKNFMDITGKTPNYAKTSLGITRYTNLVYTYAKILNFHKATGVLPAYVVVKP